MMGRLGRIKNKAEHALFARSRAERGVAAERIHLISCVGVDLEHALVPHFLDHYLALGVPAANFHIVLNTADDDSAALASVRAEMAARGIEPEEIWVEPYTSQAMWQKRRDVQRRCVPRDHWVVNADADEFHEYPMSLSMFLAECEAQGVNCVDGVFIDRLAEDGDLVSVDSSQQIAESFPVQAMIQGRIASFGRFHQPSGSIKLMAFDASLLPSRGGHSLVAEQSDARYLFGRSLTEYLQVRHPLVRFRIPLRVHHFKWHAAMAETLRRRVTQAGVSPAGQEYGQKVLDYLDRHDGRIQLSDVALRRADDYVPALDWRARVRLLRAAHYARLTASRVKRRVRS